MEKQLDNQLDCWWKAKGGVDERPGSRRWRLATMYGRRRKTDASSCIVIMIVIIGEGQGGRGPRKKGKNDKIVTDKRRRQCSSSMTTAMMESPSGVRVDLHRSVGTVRATRLCHLGGAVARRSLSRRLRRQASSVVVGGVKALGLSAGIAIVAFDRSRILLDRSCGSLTQWQ